MGSYRGTSEAKCWQLYRSRTLSRYSAQQLDLLARFMQLVINRFVRARAAFAARYGDIVSYALSRTFAREMKPRRNPRLSSRRPFNSYRTPNAIPFRRPR